MKKGGGVEKAGGRRGCHVPAGSIMRRQWSGAIVPEIAMM